MATKILLIDDAPDDLKIMTIYLKRSGFDNVITADTGEEGIEQAKTQAPDIVVTDTNLPLMHGLEVCKKLKKMDRHMKVIVQSGVADIIDEKKALEIGADHYCEKTSDCKLLIEAIKGFL